MEALYSFADEKDMTNELTFSTSQSTELAMPEVFDITIRATVSHVYVTGSTKAKELGFVDRDAREEYSDQLRLYAHQFATKNNLKIDRTNDW